MLCVGDTRAIGSSFVDVVIASVDMFGNGMVTNSATSGGHKEDVDDGETGAGRGWNDAVSCVAVAGGASVLDLINLGISP